MSIKKCQIKRDENDKRPIQLECYMKRQRQGCKVERKGSIPILTFTPYIHASVL